MEKIAIIRIAGKTKIRTTVSNTLDMLNLHNKNNCVVVEAKETTMGMIKKAKDAITWGVANEETEKLLKPRDKGKKFYTLHPPRGGYGRKGTKVAYKVGGSLGDRKNNINELIKRMI